MLRVGLTGGIGSGKSTAARRFAELGAVLVDSDVLAREVVAAGADGLAEIVTAFGEGVLGPDGGLDRPALAAVVFGDPQARARLNAIVHPRVRDRTEELIARAPGDAVVVQDVPLLVETGSPAAFALVVVVHADAGDRVRRLVESRGMTEADARARIAAQASDEQRHAAADVVLHNGGSPRELCAAIDALWHHRLVPFEDNLRNRRPVPPAPDPVDPDPRWAADGARLAARVARAAGPGARDVAHVGPTAVPGLSAVDVVDLQVALHSGVVDDPGAVEAVRAGLDAAGFPRIGAAAVGEWRHAGADPGRPVRLVLRPAGSPSWRADLLWRDWLRADAVARGECREPSVDPRAGQCAVTRHAITRAEEWAASSGWTPSLEELPGP
ncbi:MAG TPA: dephospho-CoA kinase [Pseudonocardia sp.]|nr:dephospho-CoA kinase [Pseudonocardia sp.]